MFSLIFYFKVKMQYLLWRKRHKISISGGYCFNMYILCLPASKPTISRRRIKCIDQLSSKTAIAADVVMRMIPNCRVGYFRVMYVHYYGFDWSGKMNFTSSYIRQLHTLFSVAQSCDTKKERQNSAILLFSRYIHFYLV